MLVPFSDSAKDPKRVEENLFLPYESMGRRREWERRRKEGEKIMNYRGKMTVGRKSKFNKITQRKPFLWYHSGFFLNFPSNIYVYFKCKSTITSLAKC